MTSSANCMGCWAWIRPTPARDISAPACPGIPNRSTPPTSQASGCSSSEMARPVRAAAKAMGLEALISDDYLAVEAAMAEAAPELVLGTQMERHSAKRLGIPCAVISTPMHVQDVPARTSPQMAWEGANVIFDAWVYPLMMGLEEHLIGMFRHDFEFVEGHMSHKGEKPAGPPATDPIQIAAEATGVEEAELLRWSPSGQ